MATTTTTTNKPLNPRAQDLSPKGYNRAALYSGKALDFDGVNDYVDCGTLDITGYTAISISTNLKLANTTDILRFVSLQHSGIDDLRIVQNGDTIFFTLDEGTAYSVETPTLTANEWNKLDMTFDGTTLKGYVNGVSIGSIAASFDFSTASGLLNLFKHSAASQYAEGAMAGFKIFNTALTAAQVADLYLNPEKIVPDGVASSALKLWLPMMEGAGTMCVNGAPDALGSELVTNGDFDTDSDWTKGTGWSISGGTASCDGSQSGNSILYQGIGHSANKLYQIEFTISGYVSGQIDFALDTPFFGATSSNGTFIFSAIPPSGGNFIIRANSTFVGSIDNVSVKEVQNSGVISGATWTHGIGAPVAQTSVIDWNKHTLDGTNEVLVPQGLTSGRDLLGNLFESARNPYALNLDGASWAEVHDNASLDITSAITLEAWVYWDSTEAAKGIVGKWNSASTQCYLIYVESSSRAQFYTSTTGSNAQSVEHTIPSDGWVHIVGTDDGTNQKLYINGAEEATRASFGSIFANDRVLEIGRFNEATIRQYTNQIAQPRIYNRALTATEVLRNYNADKSKFGL